MPLDFRSARLWFVRRGDAHSGPFPAGALQQEHALGRLAAGAAISPDGTHWYATHRSHEIPVESSASFAIDEWSRERERARARWADQRSGIERRRAAPHSAQDRRSISDRRTYPFTERQPAVRRDEQSSADAERGATFIALLLVALVLLGIAAYGTSNPIPVDLEVRPLSR